MKTYRGKHTTEQAMGAHPNGTIMVKCNSDSTDAHRDGATCKVIGSVNTALGIGYCVEWDDAPGVAVFITANRLRPAVMS